MRMKNGIQINIGYQGWRKVNMSAFLRSRHHKHMESEKTSIYVTWDNSLKITNIVKLNIEDSESITYYVPCQYKLTRLRRVIISRLHLLFGNKTASPVHHAVLS